MGGQYIVDGFKASMIYSVGFGFSVTINKTSFDLFHYLNPTMFIYKNALDVFPSYKKYLEGTPWEIK